MEAPVNPHTDPENNPTVAHEPTDADWHAITKFGIALALTVMVVQLALWWMFDHFSSRAARLSPPVPALIKEQAPKEPPEPRLQGNPRLDLTKMRANEDSVLHHYGWVDPERGVVRIPIERALELAAMRGLPKFQPQPGVPPAKTAPNSGDTAPGRAFGAKRPPPR
jgi:hypothetical protein